MSALRLGVVSASLGALVFLTSCASYQLETEKARKTMADSAADAATRLEPLAKEEGKDQLLYMLNYATALQMAGRNAESAKEFTAAERIADQKDYHSVSRVAGSLLLNEEVVQYKGDDFEKVLINGMNAMNFLEMGELDDALVEVRRVNEKLAKLKVDGKKEFNQSPFAFYLGAMIWEADKKFDDAYISYKQAYEVAPNYRPLREDLIRAAIKAQRPEEVDTWKKAFPEVQIKPEWKDRNRGEVVLVFANGWGPRKYPRFDNHRFPQLVAGFTPVSAASMAVFPAGNADVQPIAMASTASIYSVNDVAIRALEADYARLVASRIAGAVTKAVVADQLRQKNQLLGAVAWIALNVSDRADLRQWSTLPATFQIARASVNPGKYTVKLKAIGSSEEKTAEVDVKPGRKAFLVWRVLD